MKPVARCIAYIGLGSNLADPAAQIAGARRAIGRLAAVDELAFSGLYASPPMGPPDQPEYVNAVMAVSTGLDAQALLEQMQAIETAQGRVRSGERWGPRTLDLDLLLYGDEIIHTPSLDVPHPGMAERAFVLYPLQEIAPELVVPGLGPLADLLRRCPRAGLKSLA